MTRDQYAAARPDLWVNWQRSHDAAWIAANPDSKPTTDWISKTFASFDQYLEFDYGQPFDQPAAPLTLVTDLPANASPMGPFEIDSSDGSDGSALDVISGDDFSPLVIAAPPATIAQKTETLTSIANSAPQPIVISAPVVSESVVVATVDPLEPLTLISQPGAKSIAPIGPFAVDVPAVAPQTTLQDPGAITAPIIPDLVAISSPVVTAPKIPDIDNAAKSAQSAAVTGSAPSIRITAPSNVFAGETFRIEMVASDPDADLTRVIVSTQQGETLANYDFTGRGNTAAGSYVDVTAPASGSVVFNVEVQDSQGHSSVSAWQTVNVISQANPTNDAISTWVRVKRVPTNTPGVYQNVLDIDPAAPALVKAAVAQAQAFSQDLAGIGGYDPQQLYAGIVRAYTTLAANSIAVGDAVTPVTVNPDIGESTKTIVAYDNGNPVYQERTAGGTIQYSDTGNGGITNPVPVETFGTYQPTGNDAGVTVNPNLEPPAVTIPSIDQLIASLPTLTTTGFNPKAYAQTRSDLVLNWQRVLDPAWANDAGVQSIKGMKYPSLAAYLESDYRVDNPLPGASGHPSTQVGQPVNQGGNGRLLLLLGLGAVAWLALKN